MNFRTVGLAAAIAILTPAICNASPEKVALNACASAFASSLASPGAAAPAFKVVYGGIQNGASAVDFFTRDYSFELHANDRRTGLLVARAKCSTDVHGRVVSLSLIPPDGTLRSPLAALYLR
ncbi:MAG TPA: hypothetical protein VGO37_17850 [Steroidobacteraceae bacterium]|jgi:hypothetical protein|nr:hypothetical protein [Steroidobacteraceae bacterium]